MKVCLERGRKPQRHKGHKEEIKTFFSFVSFVVNFLCLFADKLFNK
jgi:hypothetical protein